MKKKIISLILAVVMVLSLLPVGAFAEDGYKFRTTVNITKQPESITIHPGEDVTLTVEANSSNSSDYLYYLWMYPAEDEDNPNGKIPVSKIEDFVNKSVSNGTASAYNIALKNITQLKSLYQTSGDLSGSIIESSTEPNQPSSTVTLKNVTETTRVQCLAVTNDVADMDGFLNALANINFTNVLSVAKDLNVKITGYDLSDVITITVDPNAPCRNHKLGEASVSPASCTEAGSSTGVCTLCGQTVTAELPALGHDFGDWIITDLSTCTVHGSMIRSCSRCTAYETSEAPLEEHSYVITSVKDPTCTVKGYTLYTCTVCKDSYTSNEVDAYGHSFVDGKCTRCGEKDPEYLNAPELSVTVSAGKPKLTWDAVPGAAKYYIYRSTDGVNYKYLSSTAKTSYTNSSATIGTKYYFKIVAVSADGVKSDYSNIVNKLCVPAAPNLSISRSSGKAKLSWDKVTGATKYYIYRSTDGKSYSYYTSTTKTSYTDSKASSGTKYYYKVKAVAVVGGVTAASSYSSAKSMVTTLSAPSAKITTSSGKPKVSWSKVTGADKYYIYRSTDGRNYTYLTSTTKTSYTNTGAKKNTKYYYKVKAVCNESSAANSAQSSAVSIKATK